MNPADSKTNCWEYMNCGREPGGAKAQELGVCQAALLPGFNGINGGKNGGRICWAIPRTICDGRIHGSFNLKIMTCIHCPFFHAVKMEEGVFGFQLGLNEMGKVL